MSGLCVKSFSPAFHMSCDEHVIKLTSLPAWIWFNAKPESYSPPSKQELCSVSNTGTQPFQQVISC